VPSLLDWRWSPEQIAGTLKRAFPNEPERHVSHETIYNAIYAQPRGELPRSTPQTPPPVDTQIPPGRTGFALLIDHASTAIARRAAASFIL